MKLCKIAAGWLRPALTLVGVLLALAPAIRAQAVERIGVNTPFLVKDINTTKAEWSGSFPQNFTTSGTISYFRATDPAYGTELWRSDGSAGGTFMVKDIYPGIGASEPVNLININGTIYFFANDGLHGRELWKSDGTAAGTAMIKDIRPVTGDPYDFTNPAFTCLDGKIYFVADDGAHGAELWRTDGTEAGTVMVKDLFTGEIDSYISSLTVENGMLYFFANYYVPADSLSELVLWKSDGTEAGTVMVKNFGGGDAGALTALNGTLYFFSDFDSPYINLWKSDGTTAGTMMVKTFPENHIYSQLTSLNGELYFFNVKANSQQELWKTDGLMAGTVMVKRFDGIPGSYTVNDFGKLTVMNGALYFPADDGVTGMEIWRSDGATSGTTLLRDIYPGKAGSLLDSALNMAGKLYFPANDGAHGMELWQSDGTTSGTMLLKDINPSSSPDDPYFMVRSSSQTPLNDGHGTFFFSADDGNHGHELWKSDGTAAGTVLVKDISAGDSAFPGLLTANGQTLYFTAMDWDHGIELWQSQGSATSTSIVKDIRPGLYGALSLEDWVLPVSTTGTLYHESRIRVMNGTTYFTATDGIHGLGLWKTDGLSGAAVVKDGFDSLQELTVTSRTLYFLAHDSQNGTAFWKSDGTAGGTETVKIYAKNSLYYQPVYRIAIANGTIYFSISDYPNESGIWRSDGSPGGTVKVSSRQVDGSLVSVNDKVFFKSYDGPHGNELWKADGSGVSLVKDIIPGPNASEIRNLTAAGNLLYFTVDDGAHGNELWKSDGSDAGTVMVKDIRTGAIGSEPKNLASMDGALYFSADDGIHGPELWKSDGAAAGTVLVRDICPGEFGSHPRNLASMGGLLYYCAYSPLSGDELWQSDGTAAGAKMIADITPGPKASNPSRITLVGDILYFMAANYETTQGCELWALRLPAITATRNWRLYQ